MKTVDIVIPAYNEEDCVEELARRLKILFDKESRYAWRAIIVENGSTDKTWDLLEKIAKGDERFSIIQLSRNFHMDGGLTAGLEFVTADAVVFMTADLQDPPEAISDFLFVWEQGVHNVYGRVSERIGTGPLRKFNSQAYYLLANKFTGGLITRNASDFRLMDRKLYETVRNLDERNRFMRGLVAWAGFTSQAVPVSRPPRFGGESKAFSIPVFGLAVRSIFAHSYFPIRAISIVGFLSSFVAVITFLIMLGVWLTKGVPFPGFGSIMTLVLFIFGTLTLILGVLAEYIGLIYQEVKRRPNYVVQETRNIQR
jgi:glycosyltransferase involved in cell wall biosynthesis